MNMEVCTRLDMLTAESHKKAEQCLLHVWSLKLSISW